MSRAAAVAASPMVRTCLVLVAMSFSDACSAVLSRIQSRPRAWRELSAPLRLNGGEPLTVHLASPSAPVPAGTQLVIYASGDGGWFGAAVGMFRTLADAGLPTAGFSTRAFMRIARRSQPLSVEQVTAGYGQVIDEARRRLNLPADTAIVLTGWSRGAALGVLVTTSHEIDPAVTGLVAAGLAEDERLDIEGDSDDDEAIESVETPGVARRGPSIPMYPLLARIAPRRAVVIQASGDRYLSAAGARRLFGRDSDVRRLIAIEARNHRFNGGEAAFAAALTDSVRWVAARQEERR